MIEIKNCKNFSIRITNPNNIGFKNNLWSSYWTYRKNAKENQNPISLSISNYQKNNHKTLSSTQTHQKVKAETLMTFHRNVKLLPCRNSCLCTLYRNKNARRERITVHRQGRINGLAPSSLAGQRACNWGNHVF